MGSKISDFTTAGLEKRLGDLQALGYQFSLDFSSRIGTGMVYLRHDVDLSLEIAREIARLETNLGVQATFFLQVGSSLYNSHSLESRSIIEEMLNLGHQVGLHFDARVARPTHSVSSFLAQEIDALEQLCGRKIRFFSQHKPTQLGWQTLHHSTAIDVREQVASGDVAYFSDSTGDFRWGDYRHRTATRGSFQLLLHPIWWSKAVPSHPRTSLENFVKETRKDLDNQVADTVAKFGLPDGHPLGWPADIPREVLDDFH